MYTQVGMWYDPSRSNVVWSTNYTRGVYIPVNSKVVLNSTNRHGVVVMYQDRPIILKNEPRHTLMEISEWVNTILDEKKVNLQKFTAAEKKAFTTGQIHKGMSKNAVLISRGYPPSHMTPTLDVDRWKYWNSRYDKKFVEKLSQTGIEGLPYDSLMSALNKLFDSPLGTIEIISVSKYAYITLTTITLFDNNIKRNVILMAIRGERKQ